MTQYSTIRYYINVVKDILCDMVSHYEYNYSFILTCSFFVERSTNLSYLLLPRPRLSALVSTWPERHNYDSEVLIIHSVCIKFCTNTVTI